MIVPTAPADAASLVWTMYPGSQTPNSHVPLADVSAPATVQSTLAYLPTRSERPPDVNARASIGNLVLAATSAGATISSRAGSRIVKP